MKALLTILIILFFGGKVYSQEMEIIHYGKEVASFTKIPPPPIYKERIALSKIATGSLTAKFENNIPDNMKNALNEAINIWNYALVFNTNIEVTFQYAPGQLIELATTKTFSKSLINGYFYPPALSKVLTGDDNDPLGISEIFIRLNSDINWYTDIDMNCPGTKYDLITLVLHEIAHGLGWISSFRKEKVYDYDTWEEYYRGVWGLTEDNTKFPYILDKYIADYDENIVIDIFPNESIELLDKLTSKDLFFIGQNAINETPLTKPRIYAPTIWEAGSSICHLDEDTYPEEDKNSLMTPIQARAEAVHWVGPILIGSLIDIGWTVNRIIVASSPTTNDILSYPQAHKIKWDDSHGGIINIKLVSTDNQLVYDDIELGYLSSQGENELEFYVSGNYYNESSFRLRFENASGSISLSETFIIPLVPPVVSTTVAKPTILPTAGDYSDEETIVISITHSDNAAQIYYTDNGPAPSQLYEGPFNISENKTIKSVAVIDDVSSQVVSSTYLVGKQKVDITVASQLENANYYSSVDNYLWNDIKNEWENNFSTTKNVFPDESFIVNFYSGAYGKFYKTEESTDNELDETGYLNYRIFDPIENTNQNKFIGILRSTENATISVNISEFPALQWGKKHIEFFDPWLKDLVHLQLGARNRGHLALFQKREAPIIFDNGSDYTNGVIANLRGFNDEPVYKLACPTQEILLDGKIYNFALSNWSTDEKALLWNQDKDITNVAFIFDNSEITANLKGIQLTNNSGTFNKNNQNRMVQVDGKLYKVYESMNRIWLERSSNDGSTWELMNNGKPIDIISGGKYPSISAVEYTGSVETFVIAYNLASGDSELRMQLWSSGQKEFDISVQANDINEFVDNYTVPVVSFNCYGYNGYHNRNGKILVAWEIDGYVLYKFGILADAVVTWNLNGPEYISSSNAENLTISKYGTYTFHLAWQENWTNIKYCKLGISGAGGNIVTVSDQATISTGGGYLTNYYPSITTTSSGYVLVQRKMDFCLI